MSEHKEPKWLYNFNVPKEVEVEKLVEEDVKGQTAQVMRKIKERQYIKFALKRPNRRLFERADLFYGVQLANGIREGLLTKALLLKRYREDGGALSSKDAQYFDQLNIEYVQLETDHQRFIVNLEQLSEPENQKRMKEIHSKKIEVLQRLQAFETINRALFSHTAESKADMQLANWWTVFLAYWDPKNDGNFVEFFSGDTFADRMQSWDNIYDEENNFSLEALARFSLLVSVWNAGAQSFQDFEEAEKQQFPQSENKEVPPTPTPLKEVPVVPVIPNV